MGSGDKAPPGVPDWVVPASTALLGLGTLLWSVTYVLMTLRSLCTKSYGMPLLALALNVSWEIVFALYVAEMPLEKIGFGVWLVLDVGLVYTTLKFAPYEWRANPWVARWIASIFTIMVAIGCVGQWTFVAWWLSKPGVGHGDKAGKWFKGEEGFDTTELAFWTAGVAQVTASAGSLATLLVRGHSGGTSYSIWLCRALGTICGMNLCSGLLWWYWPAAHGYFVNPFAIFLCGLALGCDIIYPVVLYKVRGQEIVLPDGRCEAREGHTVQGRKDI